MKKELVFKNVSAKNILCLLVIHVFLFGAAFCGYADNPIFTNTYTADPSPYIGQDGRLYVICSHDNPNASDYDMLKNYVLYSTTDMVNWQDHGVVFDINNVSWANLAYAPSVCYRNGTYYLYFPNGANGIGVATSSSPTGPFSDALGRAMVDRNTPNSNVEWCFDPCIFVDDDGQAYLYFGGGGPGNARVIKVNSDMTSVSGSAVTIDAPNFFEAAYMHKRNGTYYFSYSSDFSAGAATIEYMTSNNPMTGFQHRGTVLNNPWDNLGNNNHQSFIEYQGQWYCFYHNRALSDAVYQRSVCVDYLNYNSDGSMQRVNDTQAGVDPITSTSPPTPTPTPAETPSPSPAVSGNIIVRAMGTLGGENLELQVDGNVAASWTMSTEYQEFYANGTGAIELHFTNDDEVENGMDIQVDYIIYNDITYQAEDQEINTAVYMDGSCGGSYSEMMQCNGYIRFETGNSNPGSLGDVNGDDAIDIVDALLIAQFYVGLSPSDFDQSNADTNCDGNIDIVDALLIAQYYVGLISDFC
jgi:hypothetical protein